MAIRYDAKLNKQMYDAIDHYNKALRRLEKKGVSKAFLPNRISTQMLKDNYTDRRKLLRRLNQLKNLSSKGDVFISEGGLSVNQGIVSYRKQQLKIAKYNQTRRINSITLSIGKGNTYQTNKPYINAVAKRNALNIDLLKADAQASKHLFIDAPNPEKKMIRDKTFYENYFNMLFADANLSGVDKGLLDEIKAKLYQLTPDQLLQATEENKHIKRVIENYHAYTGIDASEQEVNSIGKDLTNLNKKLNKIVEVYQNR